MNITPRLGRSFAGDCTRARATSSIMATPDALSSAPG